MLKYIGKSFIVGVPARDLTEEEAKHFGRARLIGTGLYVESFDEPVKPKTKGRKKSHRDWQQAVEDTAEVTDNGRD